MPPKLTEAQIRGVARRVAAYIADQRESFQSNAQTITAEFRKALQPFFPSDVLWDVRVARGRASEPAFYPQLRSLGMRNAPAFSEMAGITFQNVIVHVDSLSRTLLFHELVHAVQYKHLGLEGFAQRYVRGFLSGGSYEEIPLEKQAYELEAKFATNPDRIFSVEAAVLTRIQLHQL